VAVIRQEAMDAGMQCAAPKSVLGTRDIAHILVQNRGEWRLDRSPAGWPLSFDKTASTAMSLRCNAFITVMKVA
jgi:hypothetical protein